MDESKNLSPRLRIVAGFVVGLLVGTSGLATAGALPGGAQDMAHRAFGAVGVDVPGGDRYWGPECVGPKKKNHGAYVRSQPQDKRTEAAASDCGKKAKAVGGEKAPEAGKGGACQGPPPWAGKGKPDKASKEARKQACGRGQEDEDKDEDEKAPGPSSMTPDTTTTTAATATTVTTATTAPVTTETSATTSTTVTGATTTTTVTTPPPAGGDGETVPSLPADPPAPGEGS